MSNFWKKRSLRNEDYLSKLQSLSRFVTPCPDILDGAFNTDSPSTRSNFQCTALRTCNNSGLQDHIESAESSDESSWESVKHVASNGQGQAWMDLIQYEKSLPYNRKKVPTKRSHQAPIKQNDLSPSTSDERSLVETSPLSLESNGPSTQVLNSLAKSVQKIEAHRCDNATDMLGQYIAHRLREMSPHNRSAAEIELHQVLMKYIAKDSDEKSTDGSFMQMSDDGDNNIEHSKNRKKKLNII